MQSPECVESTKIRHSSSNSKLHTPCRQIGLRRKKSRTSITPMKENKSPEIKTDATVEENEQTPTKPAVINISDRAVSVDVNETEENCRLQKGTEDEKLTPAVAINSEQTPTKPTCVSVDVNETEENCRLQKGTEDKKLTPVVATNSGNSQDVRKAVETLKKRIKEKEEKIAALKLAKLYRKKHDTKTLVELTERWREGCQVALQELLSSSTAHGYQVNMTQLISQLGIPFNLIRYNPDSEDFE